MPRILFFLHKVGPYHHARFNALAKHCKLTVVEILPESNEYAWEKIKENKQYESIQIIEHIHGVEQKGHKLRKIVRTIFQTINPDVSIVTGWDNRTYYAALLESKMRNIPVACVSDSTYSDSARVWYKEKIKSILIHPFDAFLVAGKLSNDYLKQLNVLVPVYKPWDVIDNEHFSKPLASDVNYTLPNCFIVCIARYIWEKNLEELVKGFHLFILENPESNLHLLIVGSGELKNKIETLILELKINRIQLIPFLQYSELPAIYSQAKALILPSIKDTWGLVVNEAMAAGLPVIVSEKCGCVPDLVVENLNGFICKPSAKSIAESITKLEQLPNKELKEFGLEGKEIIKLYSLESFSQAVMNIIFDLQQKPVRKLSFVLKNLLRIKINI